MASTIVYTLNIRGLNNDKKRRTILKWLKNNGCNIAFLQETFCQKEIEINNEWTIKHNLTNSAHSRGVAILFNNSLDFKIINIHKTDDARVILINTIIEGTETTLVNVYAPTDKRERNEFFKKLKFWIPRYADYPDNIIMGGDFNSTLNLNDRTNPDTNDYTMEEFNKLIVSLKLIDAWYIKHRKPHYTYTAPTTGSKSRIDYLFISPDFRYNMKNIKLKHAPQKDPHKAIHLEINLKKNKRGPGYWIFNAKLIESESYNILVKNIYNDCYTHKSLDWRSKWVMFKLRVEEASMKYGKLRAKMKKEYINNLQRDVDNMSKNEDEGMVIDKNKKEKMIKDLNKYYQEKDEGYVIRAKYKWKTEGERSTAYFFNLEKTRQNRNTIKKIKNNNGKIVFSDEEILKAGTDFYTILFKTRNIPQHEIDEYLKQVELENKLNEGQKKMCDEEITESEFYTVIKNLKTEKSPGCDGLTPEFYKHFWPVIKNLYMKMIKETQEKGELPYSLRKALLALLFKKGDDTLLKNYRPISLTNYDYKILCFALANRLQKVLKDIIHEDQSGYIKGRYIGSNARLIEDYFEHCQNFNIPGILLLLDFEKAFDSVEWNFMISVLEKFNFGKGFINWVKILYNKPIISIKNNGWISEDIKLSRGVRQGCPLSALLFVLVVEIMGIQIRKNDEIHGFQCGEKNIKTSMYADDTSLLLSNFDSMKNAIDTVNEFSKVAGPKLNIEKTEGILLGPYKNTIASFENVNFTNEAVRYLGIYIGHNKEECNKRNWDDKLEKIQIILEKWKKRHLSLFGKILVIKSLAASILVHPMSILYTPKEFLQEVEKIFFKFLWENAERIKRKTLIGKKEDGGLKMLDIHCKNAALKAGWGKRLTENSVNYIFINSVLKKYGIDCNYLLKCNITDPEKLIRDLNLPRFWAEVFVSINQCKSNKMTEKMSNSEFLSEPIWLNNRFKYRKSPIFISNWAKSNIHYVKDLYDNTGEFKNERILMDMLTNKSNWISEYTKIRNVFKPFKDIFDTSISPYVNIKNSWTIIHKNKKYNIKTQKSSFYYQILINQKSIRNYMEHKWEELFNIESYNWSQIYMRNIWKIKDKKLAEFKYKILCNILTSRSLLSKWNKEFSNKCPLCSDIQTIRHLLYDCPRIQTIWALVGSILNMEIRYKHIVIGNLEKNDFIDNRNLLIYYISYSIYKFWIQSENKIVNFNNTCIINYIKKDIFSRTLYNNNKTFLYLCDKIIQQVQ